MKSMPVGHFQEREVRPNRGLWNIIKMSKMSVFVMTLLLPLACTAREQPGAAKKAAPTTPAPAGEMIIPSFDEIVLPTSVLKGTLTLEEALSRRRSVRAFTAEPLTLAETGQLLWAAQGITHPDGYRTAPSAGALYPLEVYVLTPEAVYHYDPQGHRLEVHLPGDLRPALHAAALQQAAVLDAPAVFVIAAVYERTEVKYGQERGPRYVHLEAGHAAQNLLLQATALELGAVPVGAFYDDEVIAALALPADHQPLYLIPVGHPENLPENTE